MQASHRFTIPVSGNEEACRLACTTVVLNLALSCRARWDNKKLASELAQLRGCFASAADCKALHAAKFPVSNVKQQAAHKQPAASQQKSPKQAQKPLWNAQQQSGGKRGKRVLHHALQSQP